MIFKKILTNTFLQIIIIILFASIFRLTSSDLIEFKYDEALSTYQTYLFYSDLNLPQKGLIASTGMYNFPLFNYLLIIIGIFSQNPVYLSFVIALINIGIIILFYIFTKKLSGQTIAFISSLTLAVSPWAIIFSRKIWAQDLILLLAIPFYYLLQKSMEDRKVSNLALMTFLLFLLIQLHASGIFLMLAIIVIFFLYKVHIKKAKIIKGLLFASIFIMPYILYEFTSTPFCRDCVAFLEYQKSARPFDLENFLRPIQILNGLHFEFLAGKDYQDFLNSSPLLYGIRYIFIIEAIVFFISSIYFFKKNIAKLYLGKIVFIVSMLYFVTRTPAYMHYFVILLPVVCIIYALIFKYFYSQFKNNLYKTLVIIIILIFFLSKVIFTYFFFQFLNNKQALSGDYGPSFKLTENIIHQNLQHYSSLKNFNEIKQYAYIFINTQILHQKMGDFFLQKQMPEYAIIEFQKAIETNDQDLYSRANLAYIYIRMGQKNSAIEQINIIEKQNSTISAQLKDLIK